MSKVSDAIDKARGALKSVAGRSVTFIQGEIEVEVTAVVGETVFRIPEQYGLLIREETRDYLIESEDLESDGTVLDPTQGDLIEERTATGTRTYEVRSPGREPEWEWSDRGRNMMRIHCKRIQVS